MSQFTLSFFASLGMTDFVSFSWFYSTFYSIAFCLGIYIMMILTAFGVFMFSGFSFSNFSNLHWLEDMWTKFPLLFLFFLGYKSLTFLFFEGESASSSKSFIVTGHQWYWNYQLGSQSWDSYMTGTNYRNLDVDKRLSLLLGHWVGHITSADVLHSWTVPAFGIKADACPGRTTMLLLTLFTPGVFFGQCSELCGVNHSFMPICVEVF